MTQSQLEDWQIDLLYKANELREDGDDVEIVAQSTLEDAKTIFAEALEQNHGLSDPMSLPLEAQVRQLAVDAVEDETSVSSLLDRSQTPETGSASEGEIDAATALSDSSPESDPVDLSASDRAKIETLAKKRSVMSDRTPEYVENELEPRICELAGTDDVDAALEAAGILPSQ